MRRSLALACLVVAAGCGDDDGTDLAPDGSLPDLDASLDGGVTTDGGGTDGGTETDAGTPDAGTLATYFGQVVYEDRPQDPSGFTGVVVDTPAPEVRVELLDAGDEVLETVRTDAEGRFAFEAKMDGVTVRAWADTEHDGHQAVVTDRRRRATTYSVSAPAVPDAETLVRATVDEGGGPFNIVAVSWEAFVAYAPYVGPAPTLTYRWEAAEPFGCGSCYGDDEISLGGGLDDTDEYDDLIILHELGHYFVEHHSADDSPGGSHRDQLVSPVLAYGEGIAYAFAAVVRGAPLILDTFAGSVRSIDEEGVTLNGADDPDFYGTTNGTATGNLREEVVSAIAWDAFDAADPAEPFDRVSLGLEDWMRLLVEYFGSAGVTDRGASGIDLTDFLDALVCFSGVPADDVAALAQDRDFPWSAPDC
ncbi:MAG: hypothetical protein CMN30_11515 [Sandaracinus sp.]|nr:hypothetical protein [Sandaracinus sp.]|tara:strand:+ start:258 stop:1514 length:1257 start_codon:yes stop_codon:yes gene_type:complete